MGNRSYGWGLDGLHARFLHFGPAWPKELDFPTGNLFHPLMLGPEPGALSLEQFLVDGGRTERDGLPI